MVSLSGYCHNWYYYQGIVIFGTIIRVPSYLVSLLGYCHNCYYYQGIVIFGANIRVPSYLVSLSGYCHNWYHYQGIIIIGIIIRSYLVPLSEYWHIWCHYQGTVIFGVIIKVLTYLVPFSEWCLTQSTGAAEYTDLHLCSGGKDFPNECPVYDTKQSDGEAPVMLELWGMRSTPSFPSFPGLLCPRVIATDRVLSVGQIELNCVITLDWIVWN